VRKIGLLAVGGGSILLLALGLRVGADSLYDFFKKEGRPAQKSEKEGSPEHREGKSLFDFFKREEKKGAEEKEHVIVVHEYPHWGYPYPYDPFLYRYESLPRVAVGPSLRGIEALPTIPPFYPTEASPGTKMAVLRDIVLAWRDKRIELIKAHVSPDVPIACYLKRRFSHVLSPEEFVKYTEKAFQIFDTRSFRLEKIYRSHDDCFYAKGVHIFLDSSGVLHEVPVDFCFIRRGGEWVIRKVSYYGSPKGMKCVIVSASFGPDSPEVEALEAFRDRFLWPTALGRASIRAYYRISPCVASMVSRSGLLKGAVRAALKPLVWLSRKIGEVLRPCEGPWLSSL